jgi:hypothetical protein
MNSASLEMRGFALELSYNHYKLLALCALPDAGVIDVMVFECKSDI